MSVESVKMSQVNIVRGISFFRCHDENGVVFPIISEHTKAIHEVMRLGTTDTSGPFPVCALQVVVDAFVSTTISDNKPEVSNDLMFLLGNSKDGTDYVVVRSSRAIFERLSINLDRDLITAAGLITDNLGRIPVITPEGVRGYERDGVSTFVFKLV